MNDPFNQELPHKDEAERTVLGAMLQSRAAIDEARQKITENAMPWETGPSTSSATTG